MTATPVDRLVSLRMRASRAVSSASSPDDG